MNTCRRVFVILAALCMASCHTLPPPVEKVVSHHLQPSQNGRVARAAEKLHRSASRASSAVPMMSSKDALEGRLALIDSAQHSLDIQLFIWMEDYTGRLIMERVLMAADRGVRVRILLDDLILGISYNDRELAAIASHPNVELRLYNPNKLRDRMPARALDIIFNFQQRNQRMHNKTIIADSLLAIISGRNVGDHYFGYGHRYNLVDFGALLCGSVLADINDGFDSYWNSAPTYDARSFIAAGRQMPLEKFRSLAREEIIRKDVPLHRRLPLARQNWGSWFTLAARRAHSGTATYHEDAPDIPSSHRPVIEEILRQCEQSQKEIIMVTPYLVPDERIMAMIRKVRSRGVRVVLLVPTVASNNHFVVHNQYQKYRKVLLGLGVEIYEFMHRPSHSMTPFIHEGKNFTHKVGLHAKLVLIDSRVTYLGSMNFDGRAMFVNTEEGAIIRSHQLARELKDWVSLLKSPQNSWRLGLMTNGRIAWHSGEIIRTREPALDFFRGTVELMIRPLRIRSRAFPDRQVYKKH